MPQKKMNRERKSTLLEKPKEPRKYKVYVLNDDFTTFEFVIDVLMEVFNKTFQQAEDIASATHTNQRAYIASYSLDIARSKVAKATSLARTEGFPLKFEIE